MDFKTKLEKFIKGCSIDAEIKADADYSEQEVYIIDKKWIFGFYPADKKFFLHVIMPIAATRDTPPDEDYAEIVDSVNFSDVALKLVEVIATEVLENLHEEEYYARLEAEEAQIPVD